MMRNNVRKLHDRDSNNNNNKARKKNLFHRRSRVLFFIILLSHHVAYCHGQVKVKTSGASRKNKPQRRERERERRQNQRRQHEEERRQQEQQRSQGRYQNQKQEEENESTDNNSFGSKSRSENTNNSHFKTYKALFAANDGPRDIVDGIRNSIQSVIVGTILGTTLLIGFPLSLAVLSTKVEGEFGEDDMAFEAEAKVGRRRDQQGLDASNANNNSTGTTTNFNVKKIGLGLLFGSILGSITATITTMTSLTNVIYQLAMGLIRTPSSIMNRNYIWTSNSNHKIWDSTKQEWIIYSLSDEIDQLQNALITSSVVDTTYYDLLEIPIDAPTNKVKRAYYQKAKYVHPDKNPNDEHASSKFLQLHHAYTILSDDIKREQYNKYGISSSSGGGSSGNTHESNLQDILNFDTHVFYEILFGSSQYIEPYIGTLSITTITNSFIELIRAIIIATSGSDDVNNIDFEPILKHYQNGSTDEQRQMKRQVDIAKSLQQRIERFVVGKQTENEYRISCINEAKNILFVSSSSESGTQQSRSSARSTTSSSSSSSIDFSITLLHAIGTSLKLQSKSYLKTRQNVFQNVLNMPYYGIYHNLVRKKSSTVTNWIQISRKTYDLIQYMTKLVTIKKQQQAEKIEELAKKKRKKRNQGGTNGYDDFNDDNIQFTAEEIQRILPDLIHISMIYNQQDIASTLDGACWRVFEDTDSMFDDDSSNSREGKSNSESESETSSSKTQKQYATKKERLKRAKAIQIMGEVFLQQVEEVKVTLEGQERKPNDASNGQNHKNILSRLTVAFQAAQMQSKMTRAESEDMIHQHAKRNR